MLLDNYLNQLTEKYKSSTLKRYKREIDEFLLIHEPSKVSYMDMLEYFEELGKHCSHGVLGVAKASLDSYLDYLVTEGKRTDNPVKNIALEKGNKEVKHYELLSTEQLDSILANRKERYEVLKWRNFLLLSLVRHQGLTNADLFQLEVDAIKRGELKIDAHSEMNGNTFKLEPIQIEYYYEYKAVRASIAQKNSSKLFLNKRGYDITGDGITSVIDTLKPLFPDKRINNRVLRSSVIAEHYRNHNDLLATQQFARHKWASTTMKYQNLITDEFRNIIQKNHPYNFM